MDIETPEVQDETPEPSLRESLEAAFTEQEAPQDAAADREAPVSDPTRGTEAEPEKGAAPAGADRDEKGRFLPKPKPDADDHGAAPAKGGAKPAAGTPVAGPLVPQGTTPAPVVERAPQSWKPGAREHWAALPPDIRSEVIRREQEVARTLQETATLRKQAEDFQRAVGPYEAMIRAEGGEPLKAVSNLLQTAAALRTAPPVMRAKLVADMVRTFGVPIEALDHALAGQPMPQGMQQGPPQDPRVDQLLARLEAAEKARETATFESAQQEIEKFGANRDFFEDVRPLMADLIEVAAKRGEKLDLAVAYDRAVAMTPDVAKVIEQRKAAANATKARASTQRAVAASSSVKPGAPTSRADSREKATLRDDLESAVEALSGR